MIIHFYINGVRKPPRSLDEAPRLGETVQFLDNGPYSPPKYKVVRIHWVVGDHSEAHIFLKLAWTQL